MAYQSVRFRFPKFVQSALVALSATLLGGLTPKTVFANLATPLADGVYLYGERPVADQAGTVYMVFEVTDSQAVGAFYMPSSSFDCFSGDVSATRLDLNVVDSYEQTTHPYSLAVQTEPVLAAGQAATEFSITGFTPIDGLSAVDEQVLETCQNVQADVI